MRRTTPSAPRRRSPLTLALAAALSLSLASGTASASSGRTMAQAVRAVTRSGELPEQAEVHLGKAYDHFNAGAYDRAEDDHAPDHLDAEDQRRDRAVIGEEGRQAAGEGEVPGEDRQEGPEATAADPAPHRRTGAAGWRRRAAREIDEVDDADDRDGDGEEERGHGAGERGGQTHREPGARCYPRLRRQAREGSHAPPPPRTSTRSPAPLSGSTCCRRSGRCWARPRSPRRSSTPSRCPAGDRRPRCSRTARRSRRRR